jgi:hypothetical protein
LDLTCPCLGAVGIDYIRHLTDEQEWQQYISARSGTFKDNNGLVSIKQTK